MNHLLLLTSLAVGFLAPHTNLLGATSDELGKDHKAVTVYLEKTFPGKTWDVGPTAIDTDEVRAAYGPRRFYFVYSRMPRYPRWGLPAPHPQMKAYEEAMAKVGREKLLLTIGIDPDGTITEYGRDPAAYRRGMRKVLDDEGMKTAAAAALTLFVADEYGPHTVTANQVAPTKLGDAGWQCHVDQGGLIHTVNFDAARQLGVFSRSERSTPP